MCAGANQLKDGQAGTVALKWDEVVVMYKWQVLFLRGHGGSTFPLLRKKFTSNILTSKIYTFSIILKAQSMQT